MLNLEQYLFELISLLMSWFAYALGTHFSYKIGKQALEYVMSLWVQGKPNEWVVIMRNGEFVWAAIGLSTFIGPFDQVAIFPSRLNKVEIVTDQITQEM